MGMCYRVLIKILAIALSGICLAPGLGGQQTQQDLPATPLTEIPIALKGGEIGDLLRQWYSKGTAAGNVGDYYDNRDGGHSQLDMIPYPQLQKIEYTEAQIKSRENWGMQGRILPYVVFGNSSTSASPRQGGSNIRGYYVNPGGLAFLFGQYARNNLYVYPEHQDHDPGHNGDEGYGDLFPTNTPCLIASQGSSGSDQPFMKAMPYVLAAFRPEVKKILIQSGMLMPTIQMILRSTNRSLADAKDYLTGKAHPTVFQGSDVDPLAMVEMAHGINASNMPPIAILKVIKEDAPVRGVDYFEPELTEKLGDTPVVVARVFRGSNYLRKMVVSAEGSRDLNNRPLKYYWVVLRGDPAKIKIEYRNASRSVAEITVPYQDRSPIAKDSPLESGRIDIGVFVHNGAYYSPPAFVTFYALDNEARTYRADGRPLEIAYGVGTSSISIDDWKAFFDALSTPANSWPRELLRKQFAPDEISALNKVSDEFGKIHAALLEAQKAQERTNAAQVKVGETVKTLQAKKTALETNSKDKQNDDAQAALAALSEELSGAIKTRDAMAARVDVARKAVQDGQSAEAKLLEKKVPPLDYGVAGFVQRRMNSLRQDPGFWSENAKAVEHLCDSAGQESLDAFRQIQKMLVLFGVAENHGGASFRLRFIGNGDTPLAERLTRCEKGMIERLNAVALSRIVFPGILRSDWQENYVDQRITSIKEWRDVYRYAPDETLLGWRRYQEDGIREFNAEGLLVLNQDSQGRCTRARVVRYELEPLPKERSGGPLSRRVKLVPTETIREY